MKYKTLYDIIFANHTIKNFAELGIGNGAKFADWKKYLPKSNIVGVEIVSPDKDLVEKSTLDELTRLKPLHDGITVKDPISYHQWNTNIGYYRINKFDFKLHYGKNAYLEETVNEVCNEHGKFDIIMNDALHAAYSWALFQHAWLPALSEDGLLIQEEIGFGNTDHKWDVDCHEARNSKYQVGSDYIGGNTVLIEALEDAIAEGWIIYFTGIRDNPEVDPPPTADYLGIYSNNMKYWLNILEPVKQYQVTDPRNHVNKDVKAIDENDNIIWGYSLDDSSNEVIDKIRKKYNHI